MLNANWITGLTDAYDRCAELGLVGACDDKSPARPLAPPNHTVVTADIEVYVSANGSFAGAEPLCTGEGQRRGTTIAPCSYAAKAARTQRPHTPYALTERLLYIIDSEANDGHSKYLPNAEQLMASEEFEASPDEVQALLRAVYDYIGAGTLYQDLKDCPDVAEVLGRVEGGLYNPYVRFSVVMADGSIIPLYRDQRIWALFSEYIENSERDIVERLTVCYGTGVLDIPAKSLPNNILRRYPKAGIIGMVGAKNSGTGRYTVVGPQFSSRAEAFSIGRTTADKLVSMLRWLSGRQYYAFGNLQMLMWVKDDPGEQISPQYMLSPRNRTRGEESEATYTPLQNALYAATSASSQAYEPFEGAEREICLLLLGVPSNGRISVLEYRELPAGELVKNLFDWCRYFRFAEGHPCTLETILESTGRPSDPTLALQLIDNIVNATPLSRQIVDMACKMLTKTAYWGGEDGMALGCSYTWKSQRRIVDMLCRKYIADHPGEVISERDKLYARAFILLNKIEWAASVAKNLSRVNLVCWREMDAYFSAPAHALPRMERRIRALEIWGTPLAKNLLLELDVVKQKIANMLFWGDVPLSYGAVYCYCKAVASTPAKEELEV